MEVAPDSRQEIVDAEHLRLLSIGHYIIGGLYIGFASIFIFHFAFLLAVALNPDIFASHGQQQHKGPPEGLLQIFAVVFGMFILAGWAIGGLTLYVGRCIKRRVRRTLTFVLACVN